MMGSKKLRKRYLLPILLSLLALCSPAFTHDANVVIAVQPFRGLDPEIVDELRHSIPKVFRVDVEVLAEKELPTQAYYAPRNRYRAEKLLAFLGEIKNPRCTKV